MLFSKPETVAFVDLETVSLIPSGDQIWEFAGIRLDSNLEMSRLRVMIRPNLVTANTVSLSINGFNDRFPWGLARHPVGYGINMESPEWNIMAPDRVAMDICEFLDGKRVFCSNPAFDIPRLDDYVRKSGLVESWHYHGYDIPSMVAGYLMSRGEEVESLGTRYLYEKLGMAQDPDTVHTAYGDAEHLAELFVAMVRHAES